MTLPRYGEAAISDVLPSALAALGVPGEENILGLPASSRFCVLLIDGLGWNLLRKHARSAPFLSSLNSRAITATAPTTTATSLVSFGTGLPPGRHGVVGYTSRLPGSDALFNALKWEPEVDPETYQPYPTIFERADRAGIATSVISQRAFRKSGLTRAALRGPFRQADSYGELIETAALAANAGTPSLVYVYEGDLDSTGHKRGCASQAWRQQLVMIDYFAEELYNNLPDDVVLLVTADHGMVDVPTEQRIDVDDMPELIAGVTLVAGEARFRHVYTEDGAAQDVAAAWSEILGEEATALTRDNAVDAGWFGALEGRVAERFGDVVVNVHGNAAVQRRKVFPVETKLRGFHGALSDDELLVPLLISS